jgi:hypothetical protein
MWIKKSRPPHRPLALGVRVLPAFERQTAGAEQLSLRGGQIEWLDLRGDCRDGGRLALAGRVAPRQLGQHRVVGRQLRIVVTVGRAIQSPRGSLVAA